MIVYKVEHALGEYKSGSELQLPFRETLLKNRYVAIISLFESNIQTNLLIMSIF